MGEMRSPNSGSVTGLERAIARPFADSTDDVFTHRGKAMSFSSGRKETGFPNLELGFVDKESEICLFPQYQFVRCRALVDGIQKSSRA